MIKKGIRQTELLHNGNFLNAVVWKHFLDDGRVIIEKDFSSRNRFVRNTVGRFLTHEEVKFLKATESTGMVPVGALRSGPFSITEDFCNGVSLHQLGRAVTGNCPPDDVPDDLAPLLLQPDASFFENLEEGLKRIHAMGIAHLDLHNARNIIRVSKDQSIIIDWQSARYTTGILRPFRKIMEKIDLSGVYKHWNKICPDTMGPEREHILKWLRRNRKYWLLRVPKIACPAVRDKR